MANVGASVGMKFAETGEIGRAEQYLGGLIHEGEVKRAGDAGGVVAEEGVLGGIYVIVIGAAQCREAGMGIGAYNSQGLHGYVGRQNAVEASHEFSRGNICFCVKMHGHAVSMYACIGTPSTHRGDGCSEQHRECFLQNLLHAEGIGLALPTMIGRTIE